MAFDFFTKITKDEETQKVLREALFERGTVFISTDLYRHKGAFLELNESSFYVSHSLSRDEVFAYLKGRQLTVQISANSQLYEGKTMLAGLGLKRELPALRLHCPRKLIKNDPRKAIRMSTVGFSTSVTFSSDDQNIFTGRIMDISMTGAAIRPDPKYSIEAIGLQNELPVLTDIRLEPTWSLSTKSVVRNHDNFKIGIEFGPLDKKAKKNLFKYIQQMRKTQDLPPPAPTPPEPSQPSLRQEQVKPCILVFGQNERLLNLLRRALKTKFDLLEFPLKVSEIRNKIRNEKPVACLLEIQTHQHDFYRQLKKTAKAFESMVPFMFFTAHLPQDHLNLFFPEPSQKKAVLELETSKTLGTFRKVDSFINEFS